MSPYFTKYGYSARFHDEFVQAQAEAQAAQRGVWSPQGEHYPDYDERLLWWNRRADALLHFQQTHSDDPSYFEVASEADWVRLNETDEGTELVVFGTLDDYHTDWDPPRIMMAYRRGENFTLVGFGPDPFGDYDFESVRGEYAYVRGELAFHRERPQFVVNDGVEIWTEP